LEIIGASVIPRDSVALNYTLSWHSRRTPTYHTSGGILHRESSKQSKMYMKKQRCESLFSEMLSQVYNVQ